MSASADILAQAKVEVDLSMIPLGKNVRSPPTPFHPSELLVINHKSLTFI